MGPARSLAAGVVAGLGLSALRAPCGLDALQVHAADPTTAATVRALAWLAIGFGLSRRAQRAGDLEPRTLVLGATVGFFVHAGLLGRLAAPAGVLGVVVTVALLALAMALVARPRLDRAASEGERAAQPSLAEAAGLALAAAGATLALDGPARALRLLGLGTMDDDAHVALVLLALVAVGTIAFGGLARGRRAPVVLAAGLALVPGAGAFAWNKVAKLADPEQFAQRLGRFGVDPSQHGTLIWNASLAAGVLVLPAFVLGIALTGARRPRRLGAVAAGAALGTGLSALAWSYGTEPADPARALEAFPHARTLLLGGVAAGVGAVVALLVSSLPDARRRNVGLAACAAGVLLPLAQSPGPWQLVSPWDVSRPDPSLVHHDGRGFAAVEADRRGGRVVTFDRRRVSPGAPDARADAQQIVLSLAALELFPNASESRRILLVGVPTAERVGLIRSVGDVELEHTLLEEPVADPFEEWLLRGLTPDSTPVPPQTARERIAAGVYDLVIAPTVRGVELAPRGVMDRALGPARRVAPHAWKVPESTALVVWIDTSDDLVGETLGDRVLLASDGLDGLAVGVLHGRARGWPLDPPAGLPRAWRLGSPELRAPLAGWMERPRERVQKNRAAFARRLVEGAREEGPAIFATALAGHLGVQGPSPAWATEAEAREFDDASLEAFGRAAVLLGNDPFVRRTSEAVARMLVDKRMPERVLKNFEEPARAHAPWPELVDALAIADVELLDPERALGRLGILIELDPSAPAPLLARSRVLLELDRRDAARDDLERVLALRPTAREARRTLALGLWELGDERAEGLLQAYLRSHPDDAEVREVLMAGREPEPLGPPGPEDTDSPQD